MLSVYGSFVWILFKSSSLNIK